MSPPEKRVQIKVEIGHQSVCRDNRTPSGYTHDWTIFVRGADGTDISYFVEKVVFFLHESFPKPRRVCKEPPYKLSESGYGSFGLPVEIYFRNKEEPRKCRLEYDLTLQLLGMPAIDFKKVEAITFLNPSDDFEKKLLKGGAQIIGNSPSGNNISKSDSTKISSPLIPPPSSSLDSQSLQKKPQTNTPHASKPKFKDVSLAHIRKRSSSVTEEASHKPKKKKEKQEIPNSVVKEISILNGPGDGAALAEPLKVKTKKVKERRLSTDNNNQTGSPKNPNKETRHAGKEMKPKKDKEKKSLKSPETNATRKDGVKIHKFILKRTSEDAWSTADTNSSSVPDTSLEPTGHAPVSTVLPNTITTATKQNERVSAVLAEFAGDQSTSDDEIHALKTNEINEPGQKLNTGEKTERSLSPIIDKSQKPKKSKIHKPHLVVNGHGNDGKKDLTKRQRSPQNLTTQANGQSERNADNLPTRQELVEMYKKLNDLKDSDSLQKVVDIVEDCGTFEINNTQFEFDLCILDSGTLRSIKTFLDTVQS